MGNLNLVEITLKGALGERYGKTFGLAVKTPREAIRALASQFRGFRRDFQRGNYAVFESGNEISEDGLDFPVSEVTIVPRISGAGAGLAFAAFSFAFAYVTGKLFIPVVQPIEYPAEPASTPGFLFNGPTNISAQGVCVPLVYGRIRTGSVTVSESVNAIRVPPEAINNDKIFAIWKETVDTLRIVDVISEGEIEGLVDGERSIFLNNTPVAGDVSVYSSSDIEVLAGNIYELPNGHGQIYAVDQLIKVEGFVTSDNNGLKTISAIQGDRVTIYEDLTPEAPGAAVTVTAYLYNFTGVVYRERAGLPDQDHIEGFPQTEQSFPVGTTVEPGSPVVRTVTGADLDAILVTVSFPQGLYRIPDWGGVNNMWTRVKIDIRPLAGSYETAIDSQLYGAVRAPLKIDYRLELPTGVASWDVRVSKQEWVPQEVIAYEDRLDWSSYTTIIDAKLQYPDTALVAMSFNAKDFVSVKPRRAYEIYGLKVQIPSNYDPIARTYTGIWDGTFSTAWTDNPAWILYDLLTVKRYGLGGYLDVDQIDKWELYTISQFCDERVNSGFGYSSFDIEVLAGNIYELPTGHEQTYETGQIILVQGFLTAANNGLKTVASFLGDQITVSETLTIEASGELVAIRNTEPRYTFNAVLGKRDAVYKTLTAVVSNFRAVIFWGADGTVNFSQERDDATAVRLVTPSNVIDGMLTYSGSELSERHSVALVSWNDPENNYETAVEVVEDAEMIAEIGWEPIDIVAFGCTSRGQAYRAGKYQLVTERYETERLNYRASFDHADLRPGDIIAVADPVYAGVRFGGRIVFRTLSAITIDAAIDLEVGESYEISVFLDDGTLETRDITNGPGAGQTALNISPALPSLPVAGSLWLINATNVSPREFTVISVSEVEKNIFEISAIFRDPDKFARIEDDFFIEDNTYSVRGDLGDLPIIEDLTVKEYTYLDGGSVLTGARITWNIPIDPAEAARVAFYETQYRHPDADGFVALAMVRDAGANLLNIQAGVYQIRVRALDRLGAAGPWTTVDADIVGAIGPPADVENFSIQTAGSTSILTWDPVPDIDLSHYTIRFSTETAGATWGSAVDAATDITGNQISLPAKVGTYLIKAVDVFGTESVNAALTTSLIAGLLSYNVVETLTESPTFPGEHVDTFAFNGILQLGDGLYMSDWVTLASVDALAGSDVVPEGTYYFSSNPLDLGEVFSSRVTAELEVSGWNKLTLAAVENGWDVRLQLRTTDDDPGGSPTWSDWRNFIVGDYAARGFEFRIKLFSYADNVTPYVSLLEIIVDMPDRIVGDSDITCPAIGLQVDYDPAFWTRPALAVDAQDMDTGDYKTVTLQDETGFFVRFYDSGDSPVSRTFDYIAKGYGGT